MDKLCVTISEANFAEIKSIANKYKFIELRLDKLNLTAAEISEIVNVSKIVITSCLGDFIDATFAKLQLGLAAGASIIDVPFEFINSDKFVNFKQKFRDFNQEIGKKKAKYIISYHNFLAKDNNDFLAEILEKMQLQEPSFCKIAVRCKTKQEIEDLFKLFKNKKVKNLILVPMSEEFPESRLESLKLGSTFMYCFAENFTPGALGQMSFEEMSQHLNNFTR